MSEKISLDSSEINYIGIEHICIRISKNMSMSANGVCFIIILTMKIIMSLYQMLVV